MADHRPWVVWGPTAGSRSWKPGEMSADWGGGTIWSAEPHSEIWDTNDTLINGLILRNSQLPCQYGLQPTMSCSSSSSVHSSKFVCLTATSCPVGIWRAMFTWLRLLKPRPVTLRVDLTWNLRICAWSSFHSGTVLTEYGSNLTQLRQQQVVGWLSWQSCDVITPCWPLQIVFRTLTTLQGHTPKKYFISIYLYQTYIFNTKYTEKRHYEKKSLKNTSQGGYQNFLFYFLAEYCCAQYENVWPKILMYRFTVPFKIYLLLVMQAITA